MAAVIQIDAAVVSPRTVRPFLEDHAGAEEADAGHDALRHARGIGADGVDATCVIHSFW